VITIRDREYLLNEGRLLDDKAASNIFNNLSQSLLLQHQQRQQMLNEHVTNTEKENHESSAEAQAASVPLPENNT